MNKSFAVPLNVGANCALWVLAGLECHVKAGSCFMYDLVTSNGKITDSIIDLGVYFMRSVLFFQV